MLRVGAMALTARVAGLAPPHTPTGSTTPMLDNGRVICDSADLKYLHAVAREQHAGLPASERERPVVQDVPQLCAPAGPAARPSRKLNAHGGGSVIEQDHHVVAMVPRPQ